MLIGYILLNKKTSNDEEVYLGVFRAGALQDNPISEGTQEFNIWLEHVSKLSDDEFLSDDFLYDLNIAKSFCSRYASVDKFYDVIACVDVSESDYKLNDINFKNTQKEFLGYDVTDRSLHSLILWYSYHKKREDNVKNRDLTTLSYSYFHPKLNQFGLFDKYIDAIFFAKTELSFANSDKNLDTLHLVESKITKLKIYKLYKIY